MRLVQFFTHDLFDQDLNGAHGQTPSMLAKFLPARRMVVDADCEVEPSGDNVVGLFLETGMTLLFEKWVKCSQGTVYACSIPPNAPTWQSLFFNEVGQWRGTIAGPAPAASSRTTQDRFRVMWLSSRDMAWVQNSTPYRLLCYK